MFRDREEAAGKLAEALAAYKDRREALVLAVPRGGLVIGKVLAMELGLELDALLVKKLGHPRDPEYAVGAVGLTGAWIDEEAVARQGVPVEGLRRDAERVRAALRERYKLYRGGREPPALKDREVILVDDGAATGWTLLAAVDLARREDPRKVVVAVPVASSAALTRLRRRADEVVCLVASDDFNAIGQFYERFEQVSDEEAIALLREADGARGDASCNGWESGA